MQSFETPNKIYSVSELNREAKLILADHFLTLQVEGEISNLSRPASGHIYFSLKDDKAQVRCAMFRSALRRCPFTPDNGKKIVVKAQVSLYEARGDYQLIVEHMEEAGEGALRLAFEKLKQKLNSEGLFAEHTKKDIPRIPRQIGVITSPTGAAIHDVLTVLKRRFPAIPIILYPVAVQGESAQFEIAKAIASANEQALTDVLIVGRGGGSLEDLWAFNEEIVARAIFNSEIPVISAVGHEVDITIADYVADVRAPTPSVAAEYCVPDQQEWLSSFQSFENYLLQLQQGKIQQHQLSLDWLSRALQNQHPGQKLQRNAQRLEELSHRLHSNWRQKFLHHSHCIEQYQHKLDQHNPRQRLVQHQQKLAFLEQTLARAIQQKITSLSNQHTNIAQTLNAISPLATLDRGYAIVKHKTEQNIIKDSKQLQEGDLTETQFSKGRIISIVKAIIE